LRPAAGQAPFASRRRAFRRCSRQSRASLSRALWLCAGSRSHPRGSRSSLEGSLLPKLAVRLACVHSRLWFLLRLAGVLFLPAEGLVAAFPRLALFPSPEGDPVRSESTPSLC